MHSPRRSGGRVGSPLDGGDFFNDFDRENQKLQSKFYLFRCLVSGVWLGGGGPLFVCVSGREDVCVFGVIEQNHMIKSLPHPPSPPISPS